MFSVGLGEPVEVSEFEVDRRRLGIIGGAVGASFAVLVAEQLFASGCRLLVSITSAGQVAPVATLPYFVLIDRALRDEGTSYHYLPASDFADADQALVDRAAEVFAARRLTAIVGPSWTTDAPFRETEGAVAAARAHRILAVEMEAAALYAFAAARRRAVLCLAYVTNKDGPELRGVRERRSQRHHGSPHDDRSAGPRADPALKLAHRRGGPVTLTTRCGGRGRGRQRA